jgi:hypothetical protein
LTRTLLAFSSLIPRPGDDGGLKQDAPLVLLDGNPLGDKQGGDQLTAATGQDEQQR